MSEALDLDECMNELANSFCLDEQQHVLDRLRARRERNFTRQELARICGVRDEGFLDKLAHHTCPERLAMLVFVPLLVVAWADGDISSRERGIILDAAKEFGIHRGSPAFNLLGHWLAEKPTLKLRESWVAYVRALSCELCTRDRQNLANRLLSYARELSDLSGANPLLSIPRRRIKRRSLRRFAMALGADG